MTQDLASYARRLNESMRVHRRLKATQQMKSNTSQNVYVICLQFLKERGEEVVTIMDTLFSEEEIYRIHDISIREELRVCSSSLAFINTLYSFLLSKR